MVRLHQIIDDIWIDLEIKVEENTDEEDEEADEIDNEKSNKFKPSQTQMINSQPQTARSCLKSGVRSTRGERGRK